MAPKVKHIVFILILAGLSLPALQGKWHLFPEKPLHGDFEQKELPELTKSTWLDGTFQEALDPWLEQNTGFHNGLVRVHNQFDYSLFHKTNAEGVIRGRNGQLYEYDYIRAWTGADFVGEELLDRKLRQFRFLQQHLEENHDIDLVLVLEPGKASVYPEDIPGRYRQGEKTNYRYISQRARELGINLIDFNAWFMEIRDTVSYPLFPKQGTHWSEFAMWYAADSLIRYIEKVRNIELPEVIREGTEYSSSLRSTDYDVGVTLNLLFELRHGKMPYPKYSFGDSNVSRPNVLSVADSYYWNIFNTRIPLHLFNNEAFWYFYKKVYPDSYYGDVFVKDLNLRQEIEKQDVIFFMSTERFLYKIDRGFVDDLMELYGPQYSRSKITRSKTGILNLDSWFADVMRKAEENSLSLGEMLELDAHYMLRQKDPEYYFSIFGPEPIMWNIRMNQQWMDNLRKSAEKQGVYVEELLLQEAEYILKQDHPQALVNFRQLEQIKAGIRADSSWHAHILEKANRWYMTEEEMIQADAEYVFSQRE